MSEEQAEAIAESAFFLEKQEVVVNDFDAAGLILDIGGGGEGVIGQLRGGQVIAIDPNRRELEEAADGPLKIIMDAKDLQFLDNSFSVVTSFFTLMYIKTLDHKKVFEEVYRVLESKGQFLIWDVDLPLRLDEKKDVVGFYLNIKLPDQEIETGYGTKWSDREKNLSYYKAIAEQVGFVSNEQKATERVFFIELQKP